MKHHDDESIGQILRVVVPGAMVVAIIMNATDKYADLPALRRGFIFFVVLMLFASFAGMMREPKNLSAAKSKRILTGLWAWILPAKLFERFAAQTIEDGYLESQEAKDAGKLGEARLIIVRTWAITLVTVVLGASSVLLSRLSKAFKLNE